MNDEQPELMKHDLEEQIAFDRTEPPPFVEAPDAIETHRLLERVSRLPAVRFELVQQMRELIAQGKLETPERIDGTVRKLMEELGL
jgi:hypothetical protein